MIRGLNGDYLDVKYLYWEEEERRARSLVEYASNE